MSARELKTIFPRLVSVLASITCATGEMLGIPSPQRAEKKANKPKLRVNHLLNRRE
jgi:hypothetical protein